MPTEYLLTTNNFKKPDVVTSIDAVGLQVMHLLMLKPGTNPLFPEMGLGLTNANRYLMEDDLEELNTKISDQIAKYLPEYQDVQVVCKTDKDQFLICNVIIDGVNYVYTANPITKQPENEYTTMKEILGED